MVPKYEPPINENTEKNPTERNNIDEKEDSDDSDCAGGLFGFENLECSVSSNAYKKSLNIPFKNIFVLSFSKRRRPAI